MGMRTKAVHDGDDWVLNGTKCWMSGVVQADWYTVFAKTADDVTARKHDSITAFIVERALGRRRGRRDRPQDGRARRRHRRAAAARRAGAGRATSSARSAASGWPCSASTRCGRSWRRAASAWPRARSCTPTEYVQQREAFGKTIADFQGIQWEIAKLATEIEAARLLTYRVGVDGRPGPVHQGVGALPVDGQVLRHRAGGAGVEPGRCSCSARPAT